MDLHSTLKIHPDILNLEVDALEESDPEPSMIAITNANGILKWLDSLHITTETSLDVLGGVAIHFNIASESFWIACMNSGSKILTFLHEDKAHSYSTDEEIYKIITGKANGTLATK